MASSAISSATTTLYVSTTAPATYDQAGFTALTWVKVTEVSSIGAYGGKNAILKHVPVDTAQVVKRSGSTDAGTMSLTLARHTGADMTALIAVFTDRQPRAFKIAFPAALAQTDCFTGIVTSNVTNVGGADKILETNVDIELDNAIVTF